MSNQDIVPSSKNIKIAQGHSLPGEREVQIGLITEAIKKINELSRSQANDLVKYLLDTFFKGDIANFEDGTDCHITFAALRRRNDELEISYSYLCKILRVAKMESSLPPSATRLNFSCKALLLGMKDQKQRDELAEQAVKDDWSKSQMEKEVEKVNVAACRKMGKAPKVTKARFLNQVEKLSECVQNMPQIPTLALVYTRFSQGERKKMVADILAVIKKLTDFTRISVQSVGKKPQPAKAVKARIGRTATGTKKKAA